MGRGARETLRGIVRRKKFLLFSLTELWKKKTCFYHYQTVQSLTILSSRSRVAHVCFPLDPRKPSCANGWSLYKTSCFMHSARTVSESWCKAYGYCHKSFARLAKIPDNSESLSFIGGLANQVNASSVWIGSRTGVDFNCHNSQTGNRLCDKINGKGRIQGKCTDKLPFICERGERITVPWLHCQCSDLFFQFLGVT